MPASLYSARDTSWCAYDVEVPTSETEWGAPGRDLKEQMDMLGSLRAGDEAEFQWHDGKRYTGRIATIELLYGRIPSPTVALIVKWRRSEDGWCPCYHLANEKAGVHALPDCW